jgi:uridine phosphorylase
VHSTASDKKQYHINVRKGDLAKYLLVPGDPDRVPKIVEFWDSAREVSCRREFRSFTGKYKGVPISAMSSGIGPACMAIVVNEASAVGVETFIRVGSSGAIQQSVRCGDVVIASAAVRLDHTSGCYMMPEYPAVADYEVLLALIEAAEGLGIHDYHVGVTATTSDFYAGQSRTSAKGQTTGLDDVLSTLQKAGVLNVEMETATLFTLGGVRGLRTGSVCAVYANRCSDQFKPGAGERKAVKIANEAVKILNEWREVKQRKKKDWLFPSLIRQK